MTEYDEVKCFSSPSSGSDRILGVETASKANNLNLPTSGKKE